MRAGARKQALVPGGRDRARAGRDRAGLAGAGRAAVVARAARAAARAADDVGGAVADRAAAATLLARAGDAGAADPALLPAARSRRSPRRCASSTPTSLPLEITTCLRRGELEVATVFEPSAADDYAAFEAALRERHGDVAVLRRRRDDRRA